MRLPTSPLAVLAFCGLLLQPQELRFFALAETHAVGSYSDNGVSTPGHSSDAEKSAVEKSGSGEAAIVEASASSNNEDVKTPEGREGSSDRNPTDDEVDGAVGDSVNGIRCSAAEVEAAAANAAALLFRDGYLSKLDLQEGNPTSELLLSSRGSVFDHMCLFSSLVAAEDVTLLDWTHRPFVEGLSLDALEVKKANKFLQASAMKIQIPEFIPSNFTLPHTSQHSTLKRQKPLGSHQYWVPFSYRQATSYWLTEGPLEPPRESPRKAGATLRVADSVLQRRLLQPSLLRMSDVTEVMDLSDFGTSSLYHPEAYIEQRQCDGFYLPAFFQSKPLSPLGALCSVKRLTHFAEKIGRHLKARAAGGKGNDGGPPGHLGEERPGAPGAPLSGEKGEGGLTSETKRVDPEGSINRPEEEELLKALGISAPQESWWQNALASSVDRFSNRGHIAALLLQLKGRVWEDVKDSEELLLANLALQNLQRSGRAEPVLMALGSTLVNCRAHVNYRTRKNLGLPTVAREEGVFNPLIALFNNNRTTLDIPLEMKAPQTVYVDGRHFHGNTKLARINKLYFRSILMLFQFAFFAYRISEMPEDFADKPLNDMLFKHWTLSYVGAMQTSENAPMHGSHGALTPEGAEALKELGMKLVRRISGSASVVYQSDSPPPVARKPFVIDRQTGELVELERSAAGAEENPESALLSSQKIIHDNRLPGGSPDVCDRDATHRVLITVPHMYRWDRSKPGDTHEMLYSYQKRTESRSGFSAKEFASLLTLHLNDDVGLGPESRDHRKPVEGHTSSIPVHRIQTVWVFRGTVQPKQWTFNTMVLGVRDPFFSPTARLHSGFSFLFHQTIRRPMTRFVHEVRLLVKRSFSPANPYVVAFTGHSQGGASATLAAWFVSKHLRNEIKEGKVVVYCISFAGPMVGDNEAIEELNRHGAIFQHIVMDVDPVPDIRSAKGKVYLEQDLEHTLEIPLHSFARAHVFDEKNKQLVYTALSWLKKSFAVASPLRRAAGFVSRLTGLNRVMMFKRDISLVWVHVHTLPCSFTLLAGLLKEAGWSSYCSSPFVRSWRAKPFVSTLEFDLDLEEAWRTGVPSVASRIQRKLERDPLYLNKIADNVEKKYMMKKEPTGNEN